MGTVVLVWTSWTAALNGSNFEEKVKLLKENLQEEEWNGVKQLVTPEKLLEDIWDIIKLLLSTKKQETHSPKMKQAKKVDFKRVFNLDARNMLLWDAQVLKPSKGNVTGTYY